jgi:hypothetical protein
MSGLKDFREGEVGDFPLLMRSKSPFGRLGTAGEDATHPCPAGLKDVCPAVLLLLVTRPIRAQPAWFVV